MPELIEIQTGLTVDPAAKRPIERLLNSSSNLILGIHWGGTRLNESPTVWRWSVRAHEAEILKVGFNRYALTWTNCGLRFYTLTGDRDWAESQLSHIHVTLRDGKPICLWQGTDFEAITGVEFDEIEASGG